MSQNPIFGFHAHIYFDAATRGSAEELHQRIGEKLRPLLTYWDKFFDRPVGPHPIPMFEIDFLPEHFNDVVNFLILNHGVHSVLIHPETGDDLLDHSVYALWLGKQLDLLLEKL